MWKKTLMNKLSGLRSGIRNTASENPIVVMLSIFIYLITLSAWASLTIVRLMTSISKGKNTPIVLKDKISLILKLINYAILFRLSSLPKSVASYCKKGR